MNQIHIAVDQLPIDLTTWVGILLGPTVTVVGFIFIFFQLKESARQTQVAAASQKTAAESVAQAALQTMSASEQTKIAAEEANEHRRWKKAEYLNICANKFFGNRDCDEVIRMIDYSSRVCSFRLDDGRFRTFRTFHTKQSSESHQGVEGMDKVILPIALLYHERHDHFSQLEEHIRAQFDTFLFELDQFQLLIDTKLYTFEEIDVYIHYVLDLLTGRKRNVQRELVTSVYEYSQNYDFKGAVRLIDEARRLRPPEKQPV